MHVTKFSPLASTQILSCSDDTTVKIWDIPSQTAISTFISHTDYVRSGQFHSTNPHLILTGSYDATVRLFDSRSGECEMIMGGMSPSGSTPVEQVLMFPSGTVALSSSGPILRAWDLVAGGRCTRALSNHQKTVTSLAFDSNASRLLTGGLDHMVKVYDVSSYKVMHTMRYPASILCLSMSVCQHFDSLTLFPIILTPFQPDDTHIAAGMSDGTLCVRRRQAKASESDTPFSSNALRSGTFESFLGGTLPAIGEGRVQQKKNKGKVVVTTGGVDELRVESRRVKRLKEFDKLLKRFKYSAALDSVLRKVCLCQLLVSAFRPKIEILNSKCPQQRSSL